MTLEQAITTFRRLDYAAREGWPMGEPPDLAKQASDALDAIDAHLAGLPEGERPQAAHQIRQRIDSRTRVATVAPKKRQPA